MPSMPDGIGDQAGCPAVCAAVEPSSAAPSCGDLRGRGELRRRARTEPRLHVGDGLVDQREHLALVGRVSSLNVPTSMPLESFVLARMSAATSSTLGAMSIG